jgi:septum site-determining protein MinD
MITSCKGGVGKSTVSANLGIRLALDGWRTLIIDCDFGVRSLDLIMGLEDEVIFDITDIILRNIEPQKACIQDKRSENLYFCSAPYSYNNELVADEFSKAIKRIGQEMSLDYIIIDTPGDTGSPFRLAAAAADSAIVVSTYQPASIRAAERTGILLEEEGVKTRKLIINCFNTEGQEYETQPGLLEVIDKTCIQLLGIIPYDAPLSDKQSRGQDVFVAPLTNASQAFANIAKRVSGRSIPLFSGFKKIKRQKLINRIQ